MDKERLKRIRRKAGWILLKSSFIIVNMLPLKLILYLGRVLGILGYFLYPRHRRIALNNLRMAFSGKKPEHEIKTIARRCFEFMVEGSWELLYFLKSPEYIKQKVKIIGKEKLEQALARGKGVISLTAHLGNFPLLCLALKEEGFTVNTMARPMRDEKADDFIDRLRTEAGVKTIFSYPRKDAVFGSLKALADNEILIMQVDQNFGTGGVWVQFFGKLAATPIGPVVLALRSSAAIVPMFIVREGNGRHTIFIEDEVPLDIKQDKDETVLANVIKLTRIIESWVAKYPELWSWIHQRWKSRPSEKVWDIKFKVQKN